MVFVVVGSFLFVGGVVLLFVDCCVPFCVFFSLFVLCCALFAGCCWLIVVCCVLFVRCLPLLVVV